MPANGAPIFAPWDDPNAKPLIRFENVTKRFGDFTAIDNLTLDIYEREFFALLGPSIIYLLTDIDAVRSTATQYLNWIILLPLVGVWSFLLDGIFIGTTQVRVMQNTMLISVFLVFLPVWYLSQPLGNHGLWLAFISLFVARGISGGYVYYSLSRNKRWF